jgi:hypothetical protein
LTGYGLGKRYGGAGVSVGTQAPVIVTAKNLLGESRSIPTYASKTALKTTELGLGTKLSGRTLARVTIFKGAKIKEPVNLMGEDVYIGSGLKAPSNAGYTLPGQQIGSRQPIAQQKGFNTVLVGEGTAQKSYATVFKALTGETKTSGLGFKDYLGEMGKKQGKLPKIAVKDIDNNYLGYYEADRNKIYINKNQRVISGINTLFHEFKHYLDVKKGVDTLAPYNTQRGYNIQEALAQRFEPSNLGKSAYERYGESLSRSSQYRKGYPQFLRELNSVSNELKAQPKTANAGVYSVETNRIFKGTPSNVEGITQYNLPGSNIKAVLKSYKSLGTAVTIEKGQAYTPGLTKKIQLNIGKTTVLNEQGTFARGQEGLTANVGGVKTTKNIPLYTEVINKASNKGGGWGSIASTSSSGVISLQRYDTSVLTSYSDIARTTSALKYMNTYKYSTGTPLAFAQPQQPQKSYTQALTIPYNPKVTIQPTKNYPQENDYISKQSFYTPNTGYGNQLLIMGENKYTTSFTTPTAKTATIYNQHLMQVSRQKQERIQIPKTIVDVTQKIDQSQIIKQTTTQRQLYNQSYMQKQSFGNIGGSTFFGGSGNLGGYPFIPSFGRLSGRGKKNRGYTFFTPAYMASTSQAMDLLGFNNPQKKKTRKRKKK